MYLRVDRLKDLREKAGLSQRDLSRMCGLAENMVYRYENALSDPSTKTLKMISEKLGVSADFLIGLSDNPTPRPVELGLSNEEQDMVETFRREGWQGVARLSVERLPK